MWTPLITLYAVTLLALIAVAGAVAVSTTDRHRADRAAAVLKILLATTLGSTGAVMALVRLHHAGLL